MKTLLNRPMIRLFRYSSSLEDIATCTSTSSEDAAAISHVLVMLKALRKEIDRGVAYAKEKVELMKYRSNLIFNTVEQAVGCVCSDEINC